MNVHKGKILGLKGSWLSGLAMLTVETETGAIKDIPCDNAPTVRALEAAYGNVIQPGHRFSMAAIKGKEIFYSLDDMGLVLAAFTPVEDASEELIEAYEENH